MENCICEIVSYFHTPSSDAKLVLFADEDIHTSQLDVKKYLLLCSEYAQKHAVFLVSGLLIHHQNLCMCLFGPAGQLLCRQGAVQLSMANRGPLKPENHVQVIHTEVGHIALCVDVDAFHPQVLRAAALKGADIVFAVQHLDPLDNTPDRLLCSVWNAAQSNNLYVVNLAGNSCAVTCPAPLTRVQDGYLIRRTSILPVRFGLNLDRLDEVRASFPLLEKINRRLVQFHAAELKRW